MKTKFANRTFYAAVVIFLLCACGSGDKQTTQVQPNRPTATEQANAAGYAPTPISQIAAVRHHASQNGIPVALSFFQEGEAGDQIVSVF